MPPLRKCAASMMGDTYVVEALRLVEVGVVEMKHQIDAGALLRVARIQIRVGSVFVR